jgi:cell division protein FtsZ
LGFGIAISEHPAPLMVEAFRCHDMAQLKEEEGNMMFEFADDVRRLTDIRVAGVGGAGGNAVDRMITAGLSGVEFLALNTDLQALSDSRAHQTMQIGAELTQGLGSGGKPSVGEGAAEEDRDSIRTALEDANMVFITAGMGGGTGTGAAPVVAEIARKQGALTVGIVTKPFQFEGHVRMAQAEAGIAQLREVVDTLIVVPNQRLLEIVPPNTSMDEAFLIADQVLYEATRGIFEIISRHDTLNLDFADVCSVMRGMGVALMGTGRATGENRALEAAKAAIKSPLLENLDIYGSKAVLVNVLGGQVGLHDTAEAMQFIQEAAGPEAHVIFGYGVDESLGDTLQVTVIATGFEADQGISGSVSMAAAPVQAKPEPEPEPEIEPVVEAYEEPELASQTTTGTVDLVETGLEPEPEEFPAEPEMIPMPEEAPPEMEEEERFSAHSGNEEQEPLFEDPRHVGETLADEPVPEPDTAHEEVPQTPFLQRAASSGGPSVDTPPSDANARFLRPAGRRNIGEVEVPETDLGPVPISRSTASGLGPENPGEDRSTPAYIRKYMD